MFSSSWILSFLILPRFCWFICWGRDYEIAIILDTQSNRSYEKFLVRRSYEFAHELNTSSSIYPPYPHVQMWNPSSNDCSNNVTSSTKDEKTSSIGNIMTHKHIWKDYCVNRHNTDDFALLVFEGNFFCSVNNCTTILDFHVKIQSTDLFIFGYCDKVLDSYNLPACAGHAYSIKCSAVRKILDRITPCSDSLSVQFQNLVRQNAISWDYITKSEFTRNLTAISNIDVGEFWKVSIVPESQGDGVVWWLQEEKNRVHRNCSGNLFYNSTTGICFPPNLCGNTTHLDEIPDFNGYFPSSILCNGENGRFKKIYDTAATRKCFSNKKICMLGDSTLEETIHDIIVLLSGIGTNVSQVISHYFDVQREVYPFNITMNDVIIRMKAPRPSNRPHRLMDIYVPRINMSLFHRYTGHKDLAEAGEGITALVYALKTLNLFDCDMLVLQSASHDYARMHDEGCFMPNYVGPDCLQSYLRHINEIVSLISSIFPVNSSKTKIFWKSESFLAVREEVYIPTAVKINLESSVAKILEPTSIKFVNISETIVHLPHIRSNWRMHIGQYSYLSNSHICLLWTFVSTETLINGMCN